MLVVVMYSYFAVPLLSIELCTSLSLSLSRELRLSATDERFSSCEPRRVSYWNVLIGDRVGRRTASDDGDC